MTQPKGFIVHRKNTKIRSPTPHRLVYRGVVNSLKLASPHLDYHANMYLYLSSHRCWHAYVIAETHQLTNTETPKSFIHGNQLYISNLID